MGRNKALVEVGGTPMALLVADTLSAAGCEPVVLVGGDPGDLAALELRVVPDGRPGEGPLGGVLTALDSAAGDVVVVACDLPHLTTGVIETIVAMAAGNPDADVVAARTDRVEPGCALWRQSAREVVAASVASGERAVHRALARLRAVEVVVPADALRNINTPDDLAR